jgi:effector-binding domain-containing protein
MDAKGRVIAMTMTYDVTDLVLTGQFTAVVRGEIPREKLPAWLERTFHDVIQYLSRHHIEATGPPFARYTFLGDQVAVEAGFPVPCEVPPDGRVQPSRLPAGPAAVTIHHGRYEDLEDAYAAARRWLTTHGRAPIGAHWEVYHTDPSVEPDPARWRTDVVLPYRMG